MTECNLDLKNTDRAYPRTCAVCGLSKCTKYPEVRSRPEHYQKLRRLCISRYVDEPVTHTMFAAFAIEYLCNELSITDEALRMTTEAVRLLEARVKALEVMKTSTIDDASRAQPDRVISDEQRDLLRHALGVRKKGDIPGSYRNYYAADPDGPDAKAWRALVELGLAFEHIGDRVYGTLITFSATTRGEREAVWS